MTSNDDSGTAICSAKGCRQPAAWSVVWNNPKLHAPERRKVWLACADHRQHLADFLDLRGFLIGVEPFRPDAGPKTEPKTEPKTGPDAEPEPPGNA